MKRIIVSLGFIISMVVSGGFLAQNTKPVEKKLDKNIITSQTPENDSINEWTNSPERFIGVWSLERTSMDKAGEEQQLHPGTFMVVHPDASYTIFVYCDIGAVITSQGNIIIESSDEYIEVISHHVNTSFVGVSNRIEYKLDHSHLYKSFWVEKDREGEDYKRQVEEVWKRGVIPEIVYE